MQRQHGRGDMVNKNETSWTGDRSEVGECRDNTGRGDMVNNDKTSLD